MARVIVPKRGALVRRGRAGAEGLVPHLDAGLGLLAELPLDGRPGFRPVREPAMHVVSRTTD